MQINKMKNLKSKSGGFTLIELLIVIIIIGILAAIGFVAYTGSQNRAKKASAETTLSQAKTKLGEYNADNGQYPADELAFTTWLTDEDNNAKLADKFETADFQYTVTGGGNGYTITAVGTPFGGADITMTN